MKVHTITQFIVLAVSMPNLLLFAKAQKKISPQSPIEIISMQHYPGLYYPNQKKAIIQSPGDKHTHYHDVIEYKQAVTPPNIANPKLEAFATVINSSAHQSQLKIGGLSQTITLYGIKQSQKPKEAASKIIPIFGRNDSYGIYDALFKKAWIQNDFGEKIFYTNVVAFTPNYALAPQYNIPPNKNNPRLEEFAFFNKNKSTKGKAGTSFSKTILYGTKQAVTIESMQNMPKANAAPNDNESNTINQPVQSQPIQQRVRLRQSASAEPIAPKTTPSAGLYYQQFVR